MHKGISVFIDVPLDALAQRLTAIGTASRPLLHHGSGDAYTQVNIFYYYYYYFLNYTIILHLKLTIYYVIFLICVDYHATIETLGRKK